MYKRVLTVLIIFFLASLSIIRCFGNLFTQPQERWDETTNIAVIRDTISHKSFPILWIDSKPFFEKPPFWYWINIGISYFSQNTLNTVRSFSAITGILVILVSVYIAWSNWGMIAGLISWYLLLSTNQLFITNPAGIFATHTFKSADIDALFILFILISVLFIFKSKFKYSWIFAGILCGLGILTKNIIAIIPLFVCMYLMKWNRKKIFMSVMISIIFALPWYIFMLYRFGGEFMQVNLYYHLWQRTIMPIEGHSYPWWYYFKLIFDLKITFIGFTGIITIILGIYKKYFDDHKLLALTFTAILFVLIPTLMHTKLSWYILPFYPFMAISSGVIIYKFC